jgi:hypothetical protein
LGSDDEWWEPGLPVSPFRWLDGIGAGIEGWIRVFEAHGFALCRADETQLEPGFEKIAIYVAERTAEPTHVARQLPTGAWTSKLGPMEDIEHPSLDEFCGREYGRVGPILKRKHVESET